jgi:hypothetical protein
MISNPTPYALLAAQGAQLFGNDDGAEVIRSRVVNSGIDCDVTFRETLTAAGLPERQVTESLRRVHAEGGR